MRAQRAAGVECSVDGSFSSQVVDEVLERGGVQYLDSITTREFAYEVLDVESAYIKAILRQGPGVGAARIAKSTATRLDRRPPVPTDADNTLRKQRLS